MNPFSAIAFPGQNLAPNPGFSTELASGAGFLVPSGVFLADLGPQCVIQYKDFSGEWHGFASAISVAAKPLYSDGTNFKIVNNSGTIQGTNITVAGTGYSQAGTTIAIAAPASGITALATPIIGGSLTLAATTAGTGYTNPILVIPHPYILGGTLGQCVPANAVLGLTTGTITSATTGFAGAGYLSAPTPAVQTITPATFAADPLYFVNQNSMFIIDPAGTGAVITATLANGTPASGGLTGIIINTHGAGYDGTHIPAITITGPAGAANAAATALPCMALSSVTIAGTNTGYSSGIIFESSQGSAGNAPKNLNDAPVFARSARGTITQAAGVLTTTAIEDAGFGFQTVPLLRQVGNATSDGSVNATLTAVVGGVNNYVNLWQIG